MPQVVRCQVTLNQSDPPQEHIINTWHCVTVGATTTLAAATAFSTAVKAFYASIDLYLASWLNTYISRFQAWDLSDPKPRQPIIDDVAWQILSTGTGSLPRELACCVSYKGTYLSGVSPKRKRGRIYIGPLYTAGVGSSGDLSTTLVSGLTSAADTLLGVSDASSEFRWVVYSPTSDPSGEGNDAACWDAVTEGWVDNNVDIQRRRGLPGGSRNAFT